MSPYPPCLRHNWYVAALFFDLVPSFQKLCWLWHYLSVVIVVMTMLCAWISHKFPLYISFSFSFSLWRSAFWYNCMLKKDAAAAAAAVCRSLLWIVHVCSLRGKKTHATFAQSECVRCSPWKKYHHINFNGVYLFLFRFHFFLQFFCFFLSLFVSFAPTSLLWWDTFSNNTIFQPNQGAKCIRYSHCSTWCDFKRVNMRLALSYLWYRQQPSPDEFNECGMIRYQQKISNQAEP